MSRSSAAVVNWRWKAREAKARTENEPHLRIEFLTGVCRAAREPGEDAPDWPPQPDRIFSALVSAWAARGERSEERAALEWLEEQPTPAIHASDHTSRTTPDVYVPPNDLKASRAAKTYIKVMPERRPRQPRRFPVARPDDPLVMLAWAEEPEPVVFDALDAMARDVGYVGHSASLTRCRFLSGSTVVFRHPAERARRRVYPGRLRELEAAHRTNPVRPSIRPGAPNFAERSSASELSSDWLVLEAVESAVPRYSGSRPRLPLAAAIPDERLSQSWPGKLHTGGNLGSHVGGYADPVPPSCDRADGIRRLPPRRWACLRFRPDPSTRDGPRWNRRDFVPRSRESRHIVRTRNGAF